MTFFDGSSPHFSRDPFTGTAGSHSDPLGEIPQGHSTAENLAVLRHGAKGWEK
jgi:hypothetical protein